MAAKRARSVLNRSIVEVLSRLGPSRGVCKAPRGGLIDFQTAQKSSEVFACDLVNIRVSQFARALNFVNDRGNASGYMPALFNLL